MSNDGQHQLRSRRSTPLSVRPWTKVDNPMYLDLAVACVSCLGDASEVATQKVSFDKSKSHHAEEQIKQLEFMLGELRIDMQILFERNCFPAPSVASVGSMTAIETKDAAAQTDTHLSNNSSGCDNGTSDTVNINIPQSIDVPHEHSHPQGVEYQAEILRLRQENDKWQCENNEQKQTIASLCHEIEQKNQLLNAAKVFIDANIKNNENADAKHNFADNLHHTHLDECQRCAFTSDLLAQTQLDNDKLNLQHNQLKKIVLSYEAEIETLDRRLQQSIAKNLQCEKSLDHIRNLKLALKSKNGNQTQEAHELQKQVAAFEIQRSNNDESDTQSKGSLIPATSQIAIEKALASWKNELIANPAIEDGFPSPVPSIDTDTSQCERQMVTWQLGLKSSEIEAGNGEIDANFREKCHNSIEDPSMTTEKGTIPHVNTALCGSKNSIHNHVDVFVSKSVCSAKSSTMVKHEQINWKPHLLPNPTKFTTDGNTRKRSISANDTKEIAGGRKTRRVDKDRVAETIGVTKSTNEKSRTSTARRLLTEKGNCHLTKQTTQRSAKGTNGRAVSTRSHQSASKMNFLENRVISKSKTKPSNKQQQSPKTRQCIHSRGRDDDNWHKKRSSTPLAKQKEHQNIATNQYANTDSGIKLNPKSINSQLVATELKNKRKPTSTPPTTSQQPKKIDRKTCVPNILIRVVHEHEKKQLPKSLTTHAVDSLSTSTDKPRPADARAERLHHLCQLITARNSIDVLSLDDLKFLNENLDDVTLSEQVTVFVSKIDLQERLRQIEQFEKQIQKSKESLGKWCSIL